MRKSKLVWLLCIALLLMGALLTACGDDKVQAGKKRDGKTPTATAKPDTPTPTPTATPIPDTPTPTPSPTPTATPTPTGIPLTTPDSVELKQFTFDYPNDALLAFAGFLDEKAAETDAAGNELYIRYGLLYLNEDDTPELWWAENNSHADSVNFCMFDGEKVVDLGSYGEFGHARYMERKSFLISESAGFGAKGTIINGVDGTSPVRVESFESVSFMEGEETVNGYTVSGTDCDEATFNEHLSVWPIADSATVAYENGIPTVDEYGYPVTTTYTGLYQAFLDRCESAPFLFGVPDEIIGMLAGEWELEGGEIEGYEYSAKDEGTESKWILYPNGEAEYVSITPRAATAKGRMEFYPGNDVYANSSAKWRVVIRDMEQPGYDHYLTLTDDGKLFDYYVSFEDCFASCTWYVEK